MKFNYLSDAVKLLIFAAAVIIVCVIVVIGFKTTNEGKSIASAGTSQFNAMSSEYQDVSKSIYDGSTILGSELSSMIKKSIEKGEYISIVVKTLANPSGTHYNYSHVVSSSGEHSISKTGTTTPLKTVTDDKSSASYINPSAQFLGTIFKDVNNNVICIQFEQQE
ncbi:hypothetical protein H0486_06480 [Lachnospiraceae bacterium MD1]|jgi:hypothetical protein|uniref:Uncharacterized protein n=1 Tax=Variimorphobacter saccharofermentans TaxID=2755051 RepID=A0A839JYP9_9FIRM|nr:hypothetical protein [Variimorphobacter saccharofermentans]MBB2182516.1 hypothetical protein [Variimorphobacter saccharofermentans]